MLLDENRPASSCSIRGLAVAPLGGPPARGWRWSLLLLVLSRTQEAQPAVPSRPVESSTETSPYLPLKQTRPSGRFCRLRA